MKLSLFSWLLCTATSIAWLILALFAGKESVYYIIGVVNSNIFIAAAFVLIGFKFK